MHQSPRVTVITATYNWSNVLKCAITSVRWQTFQDWEMWVIGDACTDDSAQVVASFNDPRIHWYNRTENAGSQGLPNNDGLSRAKGEYVAYLGHDDIWHPTHLELLVSKMDEMGAELGHSLLEMIGAPGSDLREIRGLDGTALAFVPSCTIHRRDILQKTGLWKDFRTIDIPPDVEFMQRARSQANRVADVEQLTVFKFPSALRKNSYIECSSADQEAYIQRIQSEPDFIQTELVAIAKALVLGKTVSGNKPAALKYSFNAPTGAQVNKYRVMRGLPPMPPLKLPPIQKAVRFARTFIRRSLLKLATYFQ